MMSPKIWKLSNVLDHDHSRVACNLAQDEDFIMANKYNITQ